MSVDADYAIVLLVLGTLLASGLLVLVVGGPRPELARAMRGRRPGPARLLAMGETVGIDATVWRVLLVAGPVAGVAVAGAASLPPALVVTSGLLGGVTLPWLLGFRRDTVLQHREDAVVAMVKDLRDRLQGTPLNQVIRGLGQRPPAALRSSMTVLADIDRPLEDCLAECARLSSSALMNRFCCYAACGLKADATTFRELLPTTIIPHLDGLLRQQRARKRAVAYQRGVITLMGGVLVSLFAILYGLGPAFRAYYGTASGAATIAVLVGGFLLLVGLVHQVLRARERPQWNLEVLNRELAKY